MNTYLNLNKTQQNNLDKIFKTIDNVEGYQQLSELKKSIFSEVDYFLNKDPSLTKDIDKFKGRLNSSTQQSISEIGKSLLSSGTHYDSEYDSGYESDKENNLSSNKQKSKLNTKSIEQERENLKSEIKNMLESVISHRMDPTMRAGETNENHFKHARAYGREEEALEQAGKKNTDNYHLMHHKKEGGLLDKLLDLILKAVEHSSGLGMVGTMLTKAATSNLEHNFGNHPNKQKGHGMGR